LELTNAINSDKIPKCSICYDYHKNILKIRFFPNSETICVFSIFVPSEFPFIKPTLRISELIDAHMIYSLSKISLEFIMNNTEWNPTTTLYDIAQNCYNFTQNNLIPDPKSESDKQILLQKSSILEYIISRFIINAFKTEKSQLFILFLISFLLRFAIGLSPYSGHGEQQDFGDYEIHRHYMEITVNLPFHEWYNEIEYPPLSAYLHLLLGLILNLFLPNAIKWDISRNYESDSLKLFMRISVNLLDLSILGTAILGFINTHYRKLETIPKYVSIFICLNLPILLMIDHAHFEINCVMLGLAIWSWNLISQGSIFIGIFIFCLSVNFKQNGLYYLIPTFGFIIGKSLKAEAFSFKLSLLLYKNVFFNNMIMQKGYRFKKCICSNKLYGKIWSDYFCNFNIFIWNLCNLGAMVLV